MKIACPTCSANYSIADEKVLGRLAKIRCRKCGTSIVIDGNTSPPAVYAGDAEPSHEPAGAPPAAPAASTMYTVDFGENDQRQLNVTDLVSAYNAGTVTADTYVWTDGFADWTPLGQVEEIVNALHRAASGAPAVDETSAASQSAEPSSPWGEAAAKPAMPVAQSPVRRAGPDLFGGIENAGSEIATSASTGSSPFGGGGGIGTGARNESSVLFSLSALTSAASGSKPSLPSAPTASITEDSGLIDLKALTAAAEHKPLQAAVAAAPIVAPLGAPIGSPLTPIGLGGGPSIPPQPAKNNNLLYIVGGLVVAVIAVTLIFRLTEKDEEPVPTPAPAAPVVSVAPVATPAPVAAPLPTATEPEAKPPATGAEEETKAPTKTTTAKKSTSSTTKTSGGTSSSSSSSSTSSSSSSTTPATTTTKKSGGGCGCKADDLMCNMRCSSK